MRTKKMFITKLLLTLVCTVCLCASLVTFASSNHGSKVFADDTESTTISVKDIQMRGVAGDDDWYCYLVLLSDSYKGLEDKGETYGVLDVWKDAFTADKIKLYTSETDSGKTLQELGLANATQNRWGADGAFISFNGYYNGYSGYEVYKVEISEGCKVPVFKDGKISSYTIDKNYTFVNLCYGDISKKFGAMTPLADETTGKPEYICWLNTENADVTSVSGVEYHEDADGKYLLMKSGIHTEKIEGEINSSEYNTASKIKIRTSKEDYEGISVIGSEWKYDTNGVRFYLDKEDSQYNEISVATIYSVVIEGNCELPHGERSCITGGKIVFGNKDFGSKTATETTNFEVIAETVKTNVTGIQVRSNGANNGYNFLVLQNEIYNAVPGDTGVKNISAYNSLDKITIYMSADDTTGVKASEICNAGWWTQNMWVSGGVMFEISDANYAIYNGSTIHRITVEKDCDLPYESGTYVTKKTYTWQNDGYGSADAKNGSFAWTRLKNREVADVEGVEVRLYKYLNNTYRFITLKNSAYKLLNKDTGIDSAANYNALDKITVYMSAEDKVGVKASEICSGWWTQNLEDSSGLSFQIKETIGEKDGFEIYNGKTIYSIKIEAGCELPYSNDTVFVTENDVVYSNADYGRELAKDYAYNWFNENIELQDFGEAEVTTIHNRAYQQDIGIARFLVLFFKQEFEMNKDCAFYIHKLNMLDKVKVYSSETDTEGTLLRDIYRMSVITQGLGETRGLCIYADPSEAADSTAENKKYKYDGPHMYAVEIMEGCQIPFVQNGEFGYATTSVTKKFYNKEYGMFGEIVGQTDTDGSKRTYEAWSIIWAQKVTVNFNVVGIDDLTFESITTLGGAEIDLAEYEREGYNLVVTDSNGEEAFDIYTLPDSDVTLTLTYTKKGEKPSSSGSSASGDSCEGCSGVVSGTWLLSLLALTAAGYAIKRKKED